MKADNPWAEPYWRNDPAMAIGIGYLEISVRSYNALKNAGINLVGDCVDLLRIPGIGAKSVAEIQEAIRELDRRMNGAP